MIPSRLAGLLLAMAAVLHAPLTLADPVVENGQVILGERASGRTLDDSDEPERHLLVVIDTPYQVFAGTGTLIHVAAWTPEGDPAAGAEVYLSGHLVGRTDTHGSLAFRWGVPGNDVESYWLNGSGVSVRWDHDGHHWGGDVWFSAFSRTNSFASDHLFVYTDRGVYNPGQTLHARLIGWHLAADYSPLAPADGGRVELVLNGPDGRPVTGGSVTTDAFGAGSLDLDVPSRVDEGLYELVATYQGAQARARLRVERFEPPVIEIDHTLGRFLTRDQPSLDFDVTLGYFTGGEFESGGISVDLIVDGETMRFADVAVTGPGPHSFSIFGDTFDALREDLSEDQMIEVRIEAFDSFGRMDDVTRELRYTANPYVAIIERDRDYYSTGDPVELVVRLTDRDRVPVRGREVRLEATCAETQTGLTDDGGTAQFSLTMPEGGCTVEAYLEDVETALATTWLNWQERQPMRSHIADAIVQEDEPVHVTISFPAGFEPVEDVVHLDVVDTSGSLVNSVLVPIRRDGESFAAEGTFTAPSWGSMLLTLFCLGKQADVDLAANDTTTTLGVMTEGQNLAVHPGRELQIHLDGVPDELPPGSDLSGLVRVTNRAGEPVDAAVGVSLVDMAVISLKDPMEITPMDLFYNPELRVLSTTGSAILTWPVVSRNWGAHVMDIALPPFPWKEGGAIGTGYRVGSAIDYFDSDGAFADEAADWVFDEDDASGMVALEEQSIVMAEPAPPTEPMGAVALETTQTLRREAGGEEPPGAPPVVITIRTEFPETALWEPDLTTGTDGSVALSGQLPDEITRQQFTVVASDQRGGVGVLRHEVRVTQPLFVRTDLPDTLTVGDRLDARVAVQNLTDADEVADVTLAGPFVDGGAASQTLAVPAHGTAVAVFPVEAHQAGRLSYSAVARTALRQDLEERDIWVRPSGRPSVAQFDGSVTASAPFRQTVQVAEGGQATEAVLSVAFPAIGSAFAGLEAIQKELVGGDMMALGGEVTATALLFAYQQRAGVSEAELAPMRDALMRAGLQLQAAQRLDGGFGFWWDSESNPYVTGYAIEALLTLRATGLPVEDLRVRNAVDYLVRARTGPTWDMEAISFWEGNSETVRLGLTAELFDVLSQVPAELRPASWEEAMRALAGRLREELDNDSPEVLTYAHALLGLYHLNAAGVVESDPTRLEAAARRLTHLRHDAHWEPSWFNAYGGTIEATVAVLQVYRTIDSSLLEGDLRDTVRYLLSTRDEWGGWHNPRGTAAAIRGLLLIAPAGPEVASTVRVLVDGREVTSVDVDPDDPWLSALTLRSVDLSGLVDAGEHTVEVTYDGALELDARLAVRHWAEAPPTGQAWIQVEGTLAEPTVALGGMVDYRVLVTSQSGNRRLAVVEVQAPSNASLDRPSLAALREQPYVENVQWTERGVRLFVELPPNGSRQLDLRLVGLRTGEASVPPATATVQVGPGDEAGGPAAGEALALVVE